MGRAEGMLRAARAFLFEACDDVWKTVATGAELSLEQRAAVRLSCAQVADAAKAVVQIAYDIGGGTSVYESCPLQRCFRDMYAAVQQSGCRAATSRLVVGSCWGWSPAHHSSDKAEAAYGVRSWHKPDLAGCR